MQVISFYEQVTDDTEVSAVSIDPQQAQSLIQAQAEKCSSVPPEEHLEDELCPTSAAIRLLNTALRPAADVSVTFQIS
jgi:hypothetical protein